METDNLMAEIHRLQMTGISPYYILCFFGAFALTYATIFLRNIITAFMAIACALFCLTWSITHVSIIALLFSVALVAVDLVYYMAVVDNFFTRHKW